MKEIIALCISLFVIIVSVGLALVGVWNTFRPINRYQKERDKIEKEMYE